MRRIERAMTEERSWEMLAAGYSGRLASVSADGYPYCVPLLYICVDGKLYLHTTSARGHLRRNVESDARVCFEVDECNGVFDYGRFECDSGLAFRSVVLFGKNLHRQSETAQAALLRRADGQVRKSGTVRPKSFFPRIDAITVYAITVERITGKEQALPPISEQWPAKDRTKTPEAQAP